MGLDQFDTVLAFSGVMLTLSLLITVIVQMIVAVLGLRGNNLKWGVEHVIKQLDPKFGLDAFAGKLADAVLTHPVLAHTRARRATAIRVTEMLDVLEDIAANPGKSSGDKGLDEEQRKKLAAALTQTVPAVGAENAAHVAAVADSLLKVFPSAGSTLKNAVSQALSGKRQVEVEVEKWFNTAMDRTTERFILHTRWVTAGAAVIVCLFLHIDSLKIFGQLSADKALREQFIQRNAALLDSANEAVVLTSGQAAKALATDALKEMKDALPKEPPIPEGLITRQQGREWIESAIPGDDTDKQAAALKSFDEHFNIVSTSHLKALGNAFNRNEAILRDTTLTIVPDPSPPFSAYFHEGRHTLGVLMSILLLSLGAPFWFNALKQLTALRPVLAKKVEADKTATPPSGR